MGNIVGVEVLLEHGVSPDSVDKEQMTPLHNIFLAPPLSQTQCARLLLSAGAKIDALDTWRRTPLRIALGYTTTDLDLIRMLIENGADVNRKDIYFQSPLLKSIQGSKEATKILLNHGTDTEARDVYGNTPVLEAIYRNKHETLQMLLRHGATITEYFELKPGRRARDGPIHVIDFIAWYGSVEIMQVVVESANHHYHISHPLDTFEQSRDFPLVNGRRAGVQEHEAFVRMLSNLELFFEACLRSDIPRTDNNDDSDVLTNEAFFDAYDRILE